MLFFLVLSYIFPIVSFANTSYKTYLAIGDSIAYGYGLENIDADSYAAKVKKKYNIQDSNFKNLAISGMKCSEFYNKIQEEEYTTAIKSSELITISIGSNELLGIVTRSVSAVTGVPVGDPNFVEKAQNVFLNASALKKIQMLTSIYNTFTSEEMKVEIETAIKSYNENWSKSIEYIKRINPNATIVATEFYNPYYEFSLGSYDLGGFVDENIQKLNSILTASSNSEKEYKIAKIYSEFNTTNPRLTNVNISVSKFNVDPHPNILGHEVICNKILDALTEVTTTTKIDISTLTISHIPDQTYTGKEIKPEVTIKNGNTVLEKDKDFTVSYSNNIDIGEAKVKIIGIGNYKGNVMKTFNIKNIEQKDIAKLTIKEVQDQTYTGIKIVPDVEITDGTKTLVKNTDYELNYNDNIDVGNATITIMGIGNYKGKAKANFEIVAKDINLSSVKDIPEQMYTGQAIEPNVYITDGSAKLVEDKDYTLTYENNVDVGEATINIIGKGNYEGTLSKTFNIAENNQTQITDISDLEITDIEDKIYTGKLITPEVRIKNGENVLIKNTDYLISYTNNINIGEATAIITGIGNYTGKIERKFNIVRKDIQYTTIVDIPEQTYTGKSIEPDLIVTSDSIKLKVGQDYIVKYMNNTDEGTATIQIEGQGNYTGTVIKTFNIVKIDDDENNNTIKSATNNAIDDTTNKTTANKPLPFAGKPIVMWLAFIGTSVMTMILYLLYKKYQI